MAMLVTDPNNRLGFVPVRLVSGLLATLALAAGLLTDVASAADARPASSIEVTAEAEVEVPPDLALIEFGVRTQAETAAGAARDNAERMQAVLAALRKALGAGVELQTGSYTVRPNYAPPPRDGGPAQVTGYVATNTVQLRTAELPRLGELIDIATRAGANQVQRVAYTLRDQGAQRREALANAARAARLKAQTLASALDVKVTGFHSLVEHDVGDVRPLVRDAMLARAESAVTPMEPGLITVRARVVLTVLVAR